MCVRWALTQCRQRVAISGESNRAMFGKYFEHPLLSSLKRSRAEQPGANANINADTLSHQPLMMPPLNGCLRAAVSQQGYNNLITFFLILAKILDQNTNV